MLDQTMRNLEEIKQMLDEKYLKYNSKGFIEQDPISIPHLFRKKEDIEIAGFLTATLSWGNRKSIITNATQLMQRMDYAPFEFIINHKNSDLKPFEKFVHRTFNGTDCIFFIRSLKNIYINEHGLEAAFGANLMNEELHLKDRIANFRRLFLKIKHPDRVEKHISNPLNNSSSKRICMFLRWMVRNDSYKVDFGIWKSMSPADLCLPLDVHTGNVSRLLGLLNRKANDWKAVEEITTVLRTMDAKDPIKYDFALFGLGVDKLLVNKKSDT